MRQIVFIVVCVLVVLGIGFFAFRFFLVPSGVAEYNPEREKKLVEYRKIKALKLDASMFSDPFLTSLVSPTSTESTVVRQPAARKNPFLSSQ